MITAHRRASRSAIAILTSAVFVGAGLVAVGAASPAAAEIEPLPAEAETFLVSRTDEAASTSPALTPDGQMVTFVSRASDLVPGTVAGTPNVFLSTAIEGSGDPFSGPAVLVSQPDSSQPDAPADGVSSDPAISADGRYVAFVSEATNLVAGGGTADRSAIYVRDLVAETTVRLDTGAEPDGDSWDPDISDDGRFVVFTSDATNVAPATGNLAPDANGAPDVFVADLAPAGDGRHGVPSIVRLFPSASVPGGLSEPTISGNGEYIAATGFVDSLQSTALADTPSVFRVPRAAQHRFNTLMVGAHDADLDATGNEFAAISDRCFLRNDIFSGTPIYVDAPVAAVGTLDPFDQVYSATAGANFVEIAVGDLQEVVLSADASTVAFSTTQPPSGETAPLADPVVRFGRIQWYDAGQTNTAPNCSPTFLTAAPLAAGPGSSPSLSASGRTIALSGPTDLSTAPSSVIAIDTHVHDGLSVSQTMGQLSAVGFITRANVSDIPASAITDYGAALANAPIYRLPIYRLPIYRLPIYRLPIYRLMIGDSPIYRLDVADAPIYRLPIYRLPIYRLPIYRLDIPGGWTELLVDTPFADDLEQSVLLADVLQWANALLAGTGGTPAERAAAERIRTLTLSDVGLDDSGIDALSLASLMLGGAHLADVEIPGADGASPLERWQDIADAQGMAVTLDEEVVLAELDAAGLAVDRTGVEAVVANTLPIDATLFDAIPLTPAAGGTPGLQLEDTPLGDLDVSALTASARDAIFGAEVTGSLADNAASILPTATVADLAAGAPDTVTFGTILFSMLESADYPWEQIDPATLPATAVTEQAEPDWCDGTDRCGAFVQYQFTFDPGPGESTVFDDPTATVTLPGAAKAKSVTSGGSGPGFAVSADEPYTGAKLEDGSTVAFPLADTSGGTMREFTVTFTEVRRPGSWESTGTLTSGDLSARESLSIPAADDPDYLDVEMNNRTPEGLWTTSSDTGWGVVLRPGNVYYEWVTPERILFDEDTGQRYPSPAADEDWFVVEPPGAGERLKISTNASDGQIALALFKPTPTGTPLGVASAGPAPGTAVTEQNARDAGSPAESGADTAADTAGHVLVDQASVGGDGTATVEAASAAVDSSETWLVRVTSGNGEAGRQLYSLRASYEPEAPEQTCTAYEPAVAVDPSWPAPVVDEVTAVTSETNTLYLTDVSRMRELYGLEATDEVDVAIRAVDEWSAANGIGVDGAVVSIDADAAVRAARDLVDQNPCSMTARRTLSAAINRHLASVVETSGAEIRSIVVLGGDDVIPFAPVAQNTEQFNERSHAADLRLDALPDGSPCPTVGVGEADPCATPLSAAAAADYILTDDAYGLPDAYQSLGGYLYVPTVALGRLVDTPAQIVAQLDRYRDPLDGGLISADTSLTAGYGAWAELPEAVTANLSWRLKGDPSPLAEPWSQEDATSRLFPAGADSPRIVSLNTHADEQNLLPGLEGAESGASEDTDLITTAELADKASALEGSLVFMIGCHAGNNLPSSYYGDAEDWTDVFSNAAGYVGNTGFGLANSVTTALSERLLASYADWIGVSGEFGAVSAGEALMYAKQSYLGRAGQYSGYDEKVLMQAVYYGVPMYGFTDAGTSKSMPVPAIPDDLVIVDPGEGLASASLSLSPSFTRHGPAAGDPGAASEPTYFTVGDEEPVAVAGQPALPKTTTRVPATTANGKVARGALVTGITSTFTGEVMPLVVDAGIGVESSAVTTQGVAFPSVFATVSTQQTPDGPAALLVTTPASVQSAVNGVGRVETFTSMGVEVLYGDPGSDDTTSPVITERGFGWKARVSAYDPGGGPISRVLLLVQSEGEESAGAERPWTAVELTESSAGVWTADLPADLTAPYRWILQVVDAAGNVTTDSDRGRIASTATEPPVLADAGADLAVTIGDRVARTIEIGGAAAGDAVTARYRMLDANGTQDAVAETAGAFTLEVVACRTAAVCSDPVSFGLTVDPANTVPTASVAFDAPDAMPSSTLTAIAAGTDPDDDPVTFAYRWSLNGVRVDGASAASLALTGLAQPGDVVSVEAIPNDGKADGHAAVASITVGEDVALPTIALSAVSGGEAYVGGTWATDDVTVSFLCTGVGVDCPDTVVVAADTAGTTVERTVTDELGRSATAAIEVLLDTTAPTLAPSVSPNPVAVGGTATALPAATDATSGVASETCEAPDTSSAGPHTVACTATDVAGNTATETASYQVLAPVSECRYGANQVQQPVNADGSSVFPRISGVPIVFRLCDALGQPIIERGAVTSVTLESQQALPAKARVNERPLLLPTVKPVLVSKTGLWVGSIGSATLTPGKKYTYRVNLADGTWIPFTFSIR